MPARLRAAPDPMARSLSCYSAMNSSSPQWMKTLEERYQRLHMKIVNNTGTTSYKYNTTVGRHVHDQKLVRAAINRARVSSNARYSSTKLAVTITNGYGLNRHQVYNRCEKRLDVGTLPNSESKPLLYQRKNKNDFDDAANMQKQNRPSIGRTCVSPFSDSTTEQSSNRETKTTRQVECASEEKKEQLNEIENVFGEDKEVGKVCKESGQTFLKTREKIDSSLGLRTFNRLSKTSVSRTSNNTPTSCPAAMESFPSSHPNMTKHHLLTAHRLTSGARRTRVFKCMSSEAQHALTETISESQTAISQVSVDDDSVVVPSGYGNRPIFRKCATMLDHVGHRTDVINILENGNDVNHNDCHSDSECSLYSKRRLDNSVSGRTRLPGIYPVTLDGQTKFGTLNTPSHSHCMIPGIGRFNIPIPKDTTFEITPPGYDIRYKDVIKVDERESETPPPDIKEKAVQKCTDWLSRYTQI